VDCVRLDFWLAHLLSKRISAFPNSFQANAWTLRGFGNGHYVHKCHLIIIFDVVYVLWDAESVAK
jgi:hypothetical protein